MGYQRSFWRSLAGGGGGDVAVVRCSCSKEEVKISFIRDEWQLRRMFIRRRSGGRSSGLSVPLLFRYLSELLADGESPRLSTASISSDERAPSASPSDSTDLKGSGRRPVSLISTLSSGSGSSRDDNLTPHQLSGASSDTDLNQNLSPAKGSSDKPPASPQPDRKGRSFVHNKNNNNKAWTTSRASTYRQQPFISGTMAPNPQLTYLDRVVMEIIETERMYVRDLRMIVEDYLAHIIDQSDLSIHPEQVCALFGNIEDIYEFNSELLQDLDMCDNDPVAIARCFVMKSEYFEIYTQYCTNYPNSVAALTDCMRNKSLAKFFRDRQASLKCSLPLGSHLLKPVQRILKYHLLLQEIAKHFNPEEEGYEVVEEALYTMTGVAWYINDMKRKHEHAVRLQEIQSLLLNWKGPDLTTFGELVLEGTFKVHRAKNERTLFLFDRMLLITKRRGEHYIYKTHISCSTLMLIESSKDSLSFSVTHYKHLKQPHTVQAKTVEEKKLWAHHIKRIILENHQAIIPQKAKEAILKMDSVDPCRYRYSPERLKKSHSSQSDEFLRDARQGRRHPEKILKSNRASLEHSDSEVTLPDNERSLQPASSSSTLGSDVECVTHEEDQEEEGEEELHSRKDSVICSEEEEEEEARRLDKFLLEAEQEAERHSLSSNKENGRHFEDDKPSGTESTPEQESADELRQKTSQQTKDSEQELSSDFGPSRISESLPKLDDLKPEPSSATPDSDSKTLSSGESSEDEDDNREATEVESVSPSILPSSVLDKASAIAQHFTSSIKRASQSQDDARSLGCSSPRLPSRTGSSLSLSAESADRPPRLNSISSDPPETFTGTDLTLISPRDDSLFDPDRIIRRRRDSTLSKQDQLLIGKIKTYYENAGNQDATFSLQRRESLTYIPTGLVRSSVSRFNSIPKDKTSPPDLDPDLSANTGGRMVSSHSLDSLKSDPGDRPRSRSHSIHDGLYKDEEFRPSSDMIKVWQAMERQISQSNAKFSRAPGGSFSDPDGGARDLSTITEDTTSPSPLRTQTSGLSRTGSLKNSLRVFGEEAVVLTATIPRVAQLRAEADRGRTIDVSDQLDQVDKETSIVRHLARQYSQRIKTSKPVVRQRSQASLTSKKSLACVLEEKESSGKLGLTLPLLPENQTTTRPLSPADPAWSPGAGLSSVDSSRGVSPGQSLSRSPISPPPVEGFHWPDVRELRSKYSERSQSLKSPKSGYIPTQMFDGGLRRHSSGSSSLLPDGTSSRRPSHKPRGSQDGSLDERSKRLHRTNSLDPRLSAAQMSELEMLQDRAAQGSYSGYYVAAEAPRSNDPKHKIIVMEKLPEPEKSSRKPREEEDDGYVQIRSPTSREKISIMAVIDRCRAYQDSDEYKQREEAKPKPEPARPQEVDHIEQDESQKTRWVPRQRTETGQNNMVKNLREKFQNRS
ncbi:pleckstrin homology domain-containing family G member 3 isoform X2 [Melanotaenia boesemani]|uniref:pleckstrin homology domain-containing family G member 3 isoform X2 n=1 Tax=Melanotaenia boesemani TaxID=1250792 RepID=UPI001C04DFE7|nr:pleckstrin homology domain-containing family G member 3 isoform X2 [Melanotaenia boesemani]